MRRREGHPAQKEWPLQNLGGGTRGGGGNPEVPRVAGGWMDGRMSKIRGGGGILEASRADRGRP